MLLNAVTNANYILFKLIKSVGNSFSVIIGQNSALLWHMLSCLMSILSFVVVGHGNKGKAAMHREIVPSHDI